MPATQIIEQDNMIEPAKQFSFDKNFQEKIVQALLIDRQWATQFNEVVDIDHFHYGYLKLVSSVHLNYYKKYKDFPSNDMLFTLLREELKNERDKLLLDQVKTFLTKVATNEDLGDLHIVKEKALEFCKRQRLHQALMTSVDLINSEKYEKVIDVVKKAIHAGDHNSSGLDLYEDVESRYSETYRRTVPTGIPELDQRKILNGGLGAGELGVCVAPTGCHAKGTPIMLFDGTFKNAEDISVGDKLMGPDSNERCVTRLVRGTEQMYEIESRQGEKFSVNENHILSLKRCSGLYKAGQIDNISVKNYLEKSKTYKHVMKLWKPEEIVFSKKENIKIDPYILGIFLGDGYLTDHRIEVTTADSEIVNELKNFAANTGLGLSEHKKKGSKASGWYFTTNFKHENWLRDELTKIKLINKKSYSKFIPHEYKTSSIENRLQLLAGLIDSDGSCVNKCYTLTLNNEQLVKDVSFVAKSLGLRATERVKYNKKYNKNYFSVTISGKTNIIPTRLIRKTCSIRMQKKNPLVSGFTIKKIEKNNFFGFSVTGDSLYLMGDFTVSHNCGKSHFLVHVGAQALMAGKNVVHYTFELNERAMGIRYDSHIVDIPSLDCYDNKEEIKTYYADNIDDLGSLRIKYFPTSTASASTLQSHIDKLATQGFRPDLILVDYAGIMRSADRYELLRLELKKVMEELRALATDMDVPLWTAIQSNKQGAESDIVDLTNMAEGYGQAHVADFVLGLSRKSSNKATGFGNIFLAKNRAGVDGIKYQIHLDTAKSKMRVLTEAEASDFASSSIGEGDNSFIRRKLQQIQSGQQ